MESRSLEAFGLGMAAMRENSQAQCGQSVHQFAKPFPMPLLKE